MADETPIDPFARAKVLAAEAAWSRVDFTDSFLGRDAQLVRRCVAVDDQQRALLLTYLETVRTVTNPLADGDSYPGLWRIVSNKGGLTRPLPGEKAEHGVTQVLRRGYATTLQVPDTAATAYAAGTTYAKDAKVYSATAGKSYISLQNANLGNALTNGTWWAEYKVCDLSEARLVEPGQLKPLAEMFSVVFLNIDPTKLDAICQELIAQGVFVNPTIQGNALTGNYSYVSVQGHQVEDGSGFIFLKACKGGRNYGSLVDFLLVHTEGNISTTQYAHYWRQTYAEIVALKSAITALGNTPGVHVDVDGPHERDDGGPYDLVVRVHTIGDQVALSYRKTADETETITEHTGGQTQPDEPTRSAGTVVDLDVTPLGDGLFRHRNAVKTETPLSEKEKSAEANAHGIKRVRTLDKSQPATTSLEPYVTNGVAVKKTGRKTPGGLLDVETETITASLVETVPVEVFNDGVVSHKATFVMNDQLVPDTNTTYKLADAKPGTLIRVVSSAAGESGLYAWNSGTSRWEQQGGTYYIAIVDNVYSFFNADDALLYHSGPPIDNTRWLADAGTGVLTTSMEEKTTERVIDETDTTLSDVDHPDPRRVLYLHSEFNENGLWNYVKIEVRILKATLAISNQQEKQVEMDMRSVPKIQYTPGSAGPPAVSPAWSYAGEFPYLFYTMRRFNTAAITRTFALKPMDVAAPGGTPPDGWDVRNQYDGERMLWFYDTSISGYGSWALEQGGTGPVPVT